MPPAEMHHLLPLQFTFLTIYFSYNLQNECEEAEEFGTAGELSASVGKLIL